MKGCSEIRELLAAAVYGDLSQEERADLDAHLEACPACREELDELRRAVEIVGQGEVSVTPEQEDQFLDSLDRRIAAMEGLFAKATSRQTRRSRTHLRQKIAARNRRSSLWVAAAAVAAVALVAVGLVAIYYQPPGEVDDKVVRRVQPERLPSPYGWDEDLPDNGPAKHVPPVPEDPKVKSEEKPPIIPGSDEKPVPVAAPDEKVVTPAEIPAPKEKTPEPKRETVVQTVVAQVTDADGDFRLVRDGQEEKPNLPFELRAGDRLVARAEVVRYDFGPDLSLFAQKDVAVRSEAHSSVLSLRLEKGSIYLDHRNGTRFRVLTEHTEVLPIGTRFEVSVEPGKTTVRVEEGKVQVTAGKDRKEASWGEEVSAVSGDVRSPKKWKGTAPGSWRYTDLSATDQRRLAYREDFRSRALGELPLWKGIPGVRWAIFAWEGKPEEVKLAEVVPLGRKRGRCLRINDPDVSVRLDSAYVGGGGWATVSFDYRSPVPNRFRFALHIGRFRRSDGRMRWWTVERRVTTGERPEWETVRFKARFPGDLPASQPIQIWVDNIGAAPLEIDDIRITRISQ